MSLGFDTVRVRFILALPFHLLGYIFRSPTIGPYPVDTLDNRRALGAGVGLASRGLDAGNALTNAAL